MSSLVVITLYFYLTGKLISVEEEGGCWNYEVIFFMF